MQWKTICAICLIVLSTAPFAALGQFSGLSGEVYAETEWGTTYRVYADFDQPGDYVMAVYATESIYDDPPIVISTTTEFFQSTFATGFYAGGVNPGFFAVFPEMEFDSWLTIGGGPGIQAGVQQAGLDLELASFQAGGNINTQGSYTGGSWFSTTNPPFVAGASGKILLAQLTTTGIVEVQMNLQWKNTTGESFNATGATLTLGTAAILGCTDVSACNYNVSATQDDGTCLIPSACDACFGDSEDGTGTLIDGDADDDGICDDDEVAGCTNLQACNYLTTATDDDGSCILPNADACEFCGPNGELDTADADGDGVCDAQEIQGCTDAAACNYDSRPTTDTDNSECTYPTGCETCSGSTDGTGVVVENDDDNDGVCNGNEVAGCLDATACNFNQNATDPASCVYPDSACETCSGESDGTGVVLGNDDDGDGVCNANEILGCTQNLACNYALNATEEDGSCTFPDGPCETCGETGGVIVVDADGDGICDQDEVAGCQDSFACNFNQDATDNDASCVYPTAECASCSGETDGSGVVVISDVDGDGVCDFDEVLGCQTPQACNYNAAATDDSPCIFAEGCESCSGQTDGSGVPVLNDEDGDGVCDDDEIAGCQDTFACNYNAAATDPGASCVFPSGCESCSGDSDGTGVIVANDDDGDGVCNSQEISGCQDPLACNYQSTATDESGLCVYASGCEFCSGATDGTGEVLLADADGDGVCDHDEQPGCTYADACNFDSSATDDDGSCIYADPLLCQTCANNVIITTDSDGDGVCDGAEILGCTDPDAANFNCDATESSVNCEYPAEEVLGCTYPFSPNFVPSATTDDGSCTLPPCADIDEDGICDAEEAYGCLDENACNFVPNATENFGCLYPPEIWLDCEGDCINDSDGDGVCDESEIAGCTEPLALNFNATATDEDGSCEFPEPPTAGCTYHGACNYNPSAVVDDGTCDYTCFGCTNATAFNFNSEATSDDGSCVFDDVFVYGCTYGNACNFDPAATADNGSCEYTCWGCTDASAVNFNENATSDDGSCTYTETPTMGCTYPDACNFNADASMDDGSCDYTCWGCTDASADNFDENATSDDGSCSFCENGQNSCAGDLDNDSIVGTADLLLFLSVFGFPCN